MEEKIKISILCDLYGSLLTEKQFEFINDYYNNDLSLSEMAENNNITRQAVRDIIKKGERKLSEYEEKLKIFEKKQQQEKEIEKLITLLVELQDKTINEQEKEKIKAIKIQLKRLI